MNEEEIKLEDILNEYNKYILSRLINKQYDFSILRDMVRKISKNTDIFNYNEEQTNQEVAKNIEEFIQNTTKGKIFKIE